VKSIFDATRRVSLGIGRQQEFKAMLTSDSATLRLITVEAAKDAFLGKEARVGGKYRLTPTGGSQLFSAMSPGLYQMLRYVETSTKNVTGSDKVAKIAAEIVNRVAVLQEHALVTKKLGMLRDTQAARRFRGGQVSPGYQCKCVRYVARVLRRHAWQAEVFHR